MSYDITHWETTPEHIRQTILDAVGFIPGIGIVKYGDEIDTLAKNADKAADVAKGAEDVAKGTGDLKPQQYMEELANSGNKYNQEDVISITKTVDDKLIWLEKGNLSAGLTHVMNHATEFNQKGISTEQIPEFLTKAVKEGKIVGMQGTRPIYEVEFNGRIQRVAISIGDNGFIVGANIK